MKAIICTKYGPPDVLQLKEVEKPNPKGNEVLIRVYAATVTSGDVKLRNLPLLFWLPLRIMFGLREPRKLRYDLAGEIGSVGKDVKVPRKGDQVFAATTGLSLGSYVEYKCLPEDGVLAIGPANMTYEEAAQPRVGADRAIARACSWCCGEGSFPHPPGGSTLAGKQIDRRRADFMVEGCIVEIKAKRELDAEDYVQALSCLKAAGRPLGLLINFGRKKAQFKGLVNSPTSAKS